jgi:thiamine-monophosphate kinase
MIVMVNMSDLAAVGAEPLGILISQVLPNDISSNSLNRLQQGIHDACETCHTYVLGGDTNISDRMFMTGCAAGLVVEPMCRIGCQPGDVLYATNRLGKGNAFAFAQLCGHVDISIEYKPVARLQEGQLLRRLRAVCMDSSDGVLATLDQIMRLNQVGFEICESWQELLDDSVVQLQQMTGLPAWLFLAGHHGELELLFTLPQCHEKELFAIAQEINWMPLRLGKVLERPGVYLPCNDRHVLLDTARIRNLAYACDRDVHRYIEELQQLNIDLIMGE